MEKGRVVAREAHLPISSSTTAGERDIGLLIAKAVQSLLAAGFCSAARRSVDGSERPQLGRLGCHRYYRSIVPMDVAC